MQGVHLPFYRELQITPASEIAIEFKTGSGRVLGWLVSAGAVVALLAVFGLIARLLAARRMA